MDTQLTTSSAENPKVSSDLHLIPAFEYSQDPQDLVVSGVAEPSAVFEARQLHNIQNVNTAPSELLLTSCAQSGA